MRTLLTTFAAVATLASAALAQNAADETQPGAVASDGSQAWYTFTGQLNAQKYATAAEITPDNVGNLKAAWRLHTGDVSDGSDPKGPKASDWGATPLFVNDTLYVSTPFDRIFAVEPDTGKVKWTFDTHVPLLDPTQGELKNRGSFVLAIRQPGAGPAVSEDRLYRHAGRQDLRRRRRWRQGMRGLRAERRARHQPVEHRQQQMAAIDPASADCLQEPAVRRLGRTGLDAGSAAAGIAVCDRRPDAASSTGSSTPFLPTSTRRPGTSNVWSSMSIDTKNNLLFVPISSPSPDFFGGDRTAADAAVDIGDGAQSRHRRGGMELSDRPP